MHLFAEPITPIKAYIVQCTAYIIESEQSEHTVVLSLTFLSIYIYIVQPKFSVKYVRPLLRRKITRDGGGKSAWDERTSLPISLGSTTL